MSKVTTIKQKKDKQRYKITNWREYNAGLVNRGSLTIWIDEAVEQSWYDDGPAQRGAQFEYSEDCIKCILILKCVFGLGYRQTEGFVKSILDLMGLDLLVPCYSQICRRAQEIALDLVVKKDKPIYMVADSTGLKVFGEGEWKVRQHGYSKRRTWRKLHLGVDENTGLIYASKLTPNNEDDAAQVEYLIREAGGENIERFSGDGAYDKITCWDVLENEQIEGVITPRKDAVYWVDEHDQLLDHDRNRILKSIDEIGRKEWKIKSDYHRRSLSETAMFRFKVIFGNKLYSRKLEKQKLESKIKACALNIMTAQGMPNSVEIC